MWDFVWTRIPHNLQWLEGRVQSWPLAGLPIDKESHAKANPQARNDKAGKSSAKGYYGPNSSKIGGGGNRKRSFN